MAAFTPSMKRVADLLAATPQSGGHWTERLDALAPLDGMAMLANALARRREPREPQQSSRRPAVFVGKGGGGVRPAGGTGGGGALQSGMSQFGAGLGSLIKNWRANAAAAAMQQQDNAAINTMMQPVSPGPQPAPVQVIEPAPGPVQNQMAAVPQQGEMPAFANAIAGIESGGRYDLLGPVTRSGDRAFGKYQVMGNNIGPWSEAALGTRLTPQQFLASPQAQDAVFQHRFGEYVNKYGPEGAARAWFAGEGGMNDMGRRDQIGTTVGGYAQRFNSAINAAPAVRALNERMGPTAQPTLAPSPGALPSSIPLAAQAPTPHPLAGYMAGATPAEMMQQSQVAPASFAAVPANALDVGAVPAMQTPGALPYAGPAPASPAVPMPVARPAGPVPSDLDRIPLDRMFPNDPAGMERERARREALYGPGGIAPSAAGGQPSLISRVASALLNVGGAGGAVSPAGGNVAAAMGAQAPGTQLPPRVAAAVEVVQNPNSGDAAKQIAMMVIKEYRDSQKPKEPKDPSWGVVGQDQYGRQQYGWVNPQSRSVTPHAVPGMAQGAPGFDDVAKLRNEVRQLPSYKAMAEVAPRVKTMATAIGRDDRASDLSLVYNLAKILDPTSVVRESEVSLAQNIATIPEQFRAQVESFLTGKGRLAPHVRAAMLREALGAAQSFQDQFNRDVDQYRGIVQRNRMNEADVIPDFGELPAPPAFNAPPAVAAPTVNDIDAELRRRGVIP
ncbi:MAG: hypothetical protein IT539_13825 [Bradyrhizobiaceae bacterium]|nr:hypothetical protein [Bradyrhizobiaceae bacterium]